TMLNSHEAQAYKNHAQSLEELARRGGLGPQEALWILDDEDWDTSNMLVEQAALAELEERIFSYVLNKIEREWK
ncbi:hypothetical protein LCGC14_1665200, partial [marine sediment metagenome]